MEALIKEALKNKCMPGIVVGIYKKETMSTYVYQDQTNNDFKFEKNTLFDLASVSKVVSTTTLVLKLCEQGKLNLDDLVKNYLPRYTHNTTIKQLLAHCSGLPQDLDYKHCQNEADLMTLIYQTALAYTPNEGFVYSDVGFILLGKVIEEVVGERLDVIAKKLIFDPLKMVHTQYRLPTSKQKLTAPTEMKKDRGLVQGTVHDGKAYLLNGISGSAGVFSNAADLLLFIAAFVNGNVLKDETLQLLLQPVASLNGEIRTLGWSIKSFNNKAYLFHGGFTGTAIVIDILNKSGCVVLSNQVHYGREGKAAYITFRDQLISEVCLDG